MRKKICRFISNAKEKVYDIIVADYNFNTGRMFQR